MLYPIFLILIVLAFASPVVAARPITPLRFFLTVAIVGAGLVASGYWGVWAAFLYCCAVVVGSFRWLALNGPET